MKRTVEMLEARINLLRSRKSENGNIIRKIEREIRRLSK